jgi:hypothetical protein
VEGKTSAAGWNELSNTRVTDLEPGREGEDFGWNQSVFSYESSAAHVRSDNKLNA